MIPTAHISIGNITGKNCLFIGSISIIPDKKLPAIIAASPAAAIDTIEIKVLLPLIDDDVFVMLFSPLVYAL